MTASEAVYGLLGWLAARPQHILLGAKTKSAAIVAIAEEFCRVNWLEHPNLGWEKRLQFPKVDTAFHPSIPQKYLWIMPVTAVQITEETFRAPHPSAQHIVGVVYDPLTKTATTRGFTASCGDWIVCREDGSRFVIADAQFQKQCYLAG